MSRAPVLFGSVYRPQWQPPEQPAQPPLHPQVCLPCFFCRMRYRTMEMTTANKTREMRRVERLALNQVSMKMEDERIRKLITELRGVIK